MATSRTEQIEVRLAGITVTVAYTMAVPAEWQTFDLDDWADPNYPDQTEWSLTGNVVVTITGTGTLYGRIDRPQGQSGRVAVLEGLFTAADSPLSISTKGQGPRTVGDLLEVHVEALS